MFVYDLDTMREKSQDFSFSIKKMIYDLDILREELSEADNRSVSKAAGSGFEEILYELTFLSGAFAGAEEEYSKSFKDIQALVRNYGIGIDSRGTVGKADPGIVVETCLNTGSNTNLEIESKSVLEITDGVPVDQRNFSSQINRINHLKKEFALACRIVDGQDIFWQGEAAGVFRNQWKVQENCMNLLICALEEVFGKPENMSNENDTSGISDALDPGFLD